VISAYEVSETQLKAIAGALKRRLGRDIDLTTRIDTALVGGIVIRAGASSSTAPCRASCTRWQPI